MQIRHYFIIWPTLLVILLLGHLTAFAQAPIYQCRIVKQYPHDPDTSTQGLIFHNNTLYESSGGFGSSFMAAVDIQTGKHLGSHSLAGRYFAEGLTAYNDKLFLITWMSGTGFVFDQQTLEPLTSFAYRSNGENIEGWGLTFDKQRFIISSGTAKLHFYDPTDFTRTGSLVVRDGDEPVRMLNELEYVGGLLLANIWKTDMIAVINLESGQVEAWVDISTLRRHLSVNSGVANGIAYDSESGRLFITGKHWDKLFHIEIDEALWRQPVINKQ